VATIYKHFDFRSHLIRKKKKWTGRDFHQPFASGISGIEHSEIPRSFSPSFCPWAKGCFEPGASPLPAARYNRI